MKTTCMRNVLPFVKRGTPIPRDVRWCYRCWKSCTQKSFDYSIENQYTISQLACMAIGKAPAKNVVCK